MFGDYDFLGMMFGISGAAGKHPCLWCTATTDQIQLHPSKRKECATVRTLKSMEADLNTFRTTLNGQISRAKEANNVIDEPLFDIPLNQVNIYVPFVFVYIIEK